MIDFDSSGPTIGSHCDATRFVDWLDAVHDLAIQFPQLALIVFDMKSDAATAAHGVEILNAVRAHLNTGPVQVSVIFSIATRDDAAIFDDMLGQLGEHEGAQVDAEDDATDIVQFFLDRGLSSRIGYGDGTTFQGPNLPRALDKAAFLRATVGLPSSVTYVYTLNQDSSMHSFISGGVDGIIPDTFGAPQSVDPSYITQLAGIVAQHPEVRLATRADDPFKPALQSYGVEVTTSNDLFSGTDADITFTLNGCRGSARVIVDTGDILTPFYDSGRMRDGRADWATIPSTNLGKLSSITIFNDGTGDAPGWNLVDVAVGSARFLGPDFGGSVEYRAHFDDAIDGGDTVTLALTPNFPEPVPTIQCPAPIAVPNAPGLCSAAVSFAPVVDGMCPDVTAQSTPASGSAFPVGTTTVSSFADSPTTGRSPACSFDVTVNDVEPPTIRCPAPIVVDAVAPDGAPVGFAPTASDNCAIATPTSSPVSGSVFPIGTTTVTATAADPAGNPASCSFTVHVEGADEQLADLIATVNGLTIKPGIRIALLAKLDAARRALALPIPLPGVACIELHGFIELCDLLSGKAIDPGDARSLIDDATRIRSVLGC